jgi:hypothetical protein
MRQRRQNRLGLVSNPVSTGDAFDGAGYVALLERLRAAPEFRRAIEEPINAAVAVPADVPLVINEGNHLRARGRQSASCSTRPGMWSRTRTRGCGC